jgi:hypothetical protein
MGDLNGDEPGKEPIVNSRDHYITIAEAAKLVATPHLHVSYASLWRAARLGTLARDGTRIHLRCHRIGGRLLTRHSWLEDYAAKVAEADLIHFNRGPSKGAVVAPPKSTGRVAQTRFNRAASACDAEGL